MDEKLIGKSPPLKFSQEENFFLKTFHAILTRNDFPSKDSNFREEVIV